MMDMGSILRRTVLIIHRATRKSIQEIWKGLVDEIRSGKVPYKVPMVCPLCLSPKTRVISTIGGQLEILRKHSCGLCGRPFQTVQILEVETKEERPLRPGPMLEPPKKKKREPRRSPDRATKRGGRG